MSTLFLTTLKMSIAASILILVVLCLRIPLKKCPKWITVLLWGVVSIRLICPLATESPVSLMPHSVGSGELVAEWTDDYIGENDIIEPNSPIYNAAIEAGIKPVSDGEGGYYIVTRHDQLREPSTVENTVIPVLSVIWVTGMILFALYTAVSYIRLQRKVFAAVLYKDNIYRSEHVGSPFVLGILKPRIYIPCCLGSGDIDHVIAHEKAHIHRKDHWWKPLGFLLLTFHWFNPLMWLSYFLLCRDIELACDERVIRDLGHEARADYTQALLDCSVNRNMISVCPLAFGEVGVKERVKSVMNYKKSAFWIVLVSVIICIAVAACFLTNPSAKDSLLWAQSVSADDIESADFDNLPHGIDEDLMHLDHFQIVKMTSLLNQSKGKKLSKPEEVDGDSVSFYITMKDGTTHTVQNVGNVYLVIDNDYYDAEYTWLSTWNHLFENTDGISDGKEISHAVFWARLIEIHDGYYLVEPLEGCWERNSSHFIEVHTDHLLPDTDMGEGDIIEIEYNGELAETYPAMIQGVYRISKVSFRKRWDCTMTCLLASTSTDSVVTYYTDLVTSDTGILSFQNQNAFDITVHISDGEQENKLDLTPGQLLMYPAEIGKEYAIGIHADAPEGTVFHLLVYDGEVTPAHSGTWGNTAELDHSYLIIGQDNVKSIEYVLGNTSGDCYAAYSKGQYIDLETLTGSNDLQGLMLYAKDEQGVVVWFGRIPNIDPGYNYYQSFSNGWEIVYVVK